MIVKVGGVNGSGKTSLARAFMDKWGEQQHWEQIPLHRGKPKIGEYRHRITRGEPLAELFDHVVVLGDYRNVCGGMDAIGDKEDRLALVQKYAQRGAGSVLVFYEGLITGKTWGAMGALALATRQQVPWLFVFMDTPFDVCVQRVLTRRLAKGNTNEFDPERTMRPTYNSVVRVNEVAWKQHGFPVHDAHYMHSPGKQVIELVQAIRSAHRNWGFAPGHAMVGTGRVQQAAKQANLSREQAALARMRGGAR